MVDVVKLSNTLASPCEGVKSSFVNSKIGIVPDWVKRLDLIGLRKTGIMNMTYLRYGCDFSEPGFQKLFTASGNDEFYIYTFSRRFG